MQKKSAGHFQLACACAFEGLHGGATNEAGINHPAQVGGINQGRLTATVRMRKGLSPLEAAMKHMLDIHCSDPMSIHLSPFPPAHRPSLPQYYLESRRVHDEREGKEAAAPAASMGPGA